MENNENQPGICPKCKRSDQVIRIVYGLPGKELIKDAHEGKVRLGGCIVDPNNPQWYCKRDKLEF